MRLNLYGWEIVRRSCTGKGITSRQYYGGPRSAESERLAHLKTQRASSRNVIICYLNFSVNWHPNGPGIAGFAANKKRPFMRARGVRVQHGTTSDTAERWPDCSGMLQAAATSVSPERENGGEGQARQNRVTCACHVTRLTPAYVNSPHLAASPLRSQTRQFEPDYPIVVPRHEPAVSLEGGPDRSLLRPPARARVHASPHPQIPPRNSNIP